MTARNRLRSSAGLLAFTFLGGGLAGCGHHLSFPQTAVSQNNRFAGPDVASGSKRRFIASVETFGRSADGAYQIRTLHYPGVKLHETSAYQTSAGTFTQITYSSPYGMFTLVQSPKIAVPAQDQLGAASSDSVGSATTVTVIQQGRTANGASWLIFKEPHQNAYRIHLEFSDSVIDTSVPPGVPIHAIEDVIEAVS